MTRTTWLAVYGGSTTDEVDSTKALVWDMLRYEACWPITQPTNAPYGWLFLEKEGDRWSPDRWESFGFRRDITLIGPTPSIPQLLDRVQSAHTKLVAPRVSALEQAETKMRQYGTGVDQ